jgi:hypothetical protein
MGGKGSGGNHGGAGRKRQLSDTEGEQIAREFRNRMEAWAGAQAIGRDPHMRKRWETEKKMEALAKKHPPLSFERQEKDEWDGNVYFYKNAGHLFKPLEAELVRLDGVDRKRQETQPKRPNISPLKRAKGPRARFIRELAAEHRITQRMVIRCINEF